MSVDVSASERTVQGIIFSFARQIFVLEKSILQVYQTPFAGLNSVLEFLSLLYSLDIHGLRETLVYGLWSIIIIVKLLSWII